MSQALARGVLICLAVLLLIRTWSLYRAVRASQPVAGRADAAACSSVGGPSGQGSPVRCYHLMVSGPPPAGEESSVSPREQSPSFVVQEGAAGGAALRAALDGGAVRYCYSGGLVYRAHVARGVDEFRAQGAFGLVLSPPRVPTDPAEFPPGPAAAAEYAWAGPEGASPAPAYLMFF